MMEKPETPHREWNEARIRRSQQSTNQIHQAREQSGRNKRVPQFGRDCLLRGPAQTARDTRSSARVPKQATDLDPNLTATTADDVVFIASETDEAAYTTA